VGWNTASVEVVSKMQSSQTDARRNAVPAVDDDFSLAVGGPLYRMLLKTRLAKAPLRCLRRRLLVIPALAWLPLLVLTMIEGRATGGVAIPFLHDIEAYARFLIALPVLVVAEVILHRRMGNVIGQFRIRGIVSQGMEPKFSEAIASTLRLRDSRMPELTILAIVLVAAPLAWHHAPSLPASTWYADVDGRVELTGAGWWFVLVSVPLSQFLLLRLYFRLFIWGRFLWEASRLPLKILPAHPDRAGGLGFLEQSVSAFRPLLFAQTIIVSGFIASRVLFDGRNVLDFKIDIGMLVLVLVVAILLPLCLLSNRLVAARLAALQDYGALGASYVREFENKWLAGQSPSKEALVGSADIQSLADLAGSYDIVNGMRAVPFSSRTVMEVLAVCLLPFLPLVFTVFSLRELLVRLTHVLL